MPPGTTSGHVLVAVVAATNTATTWTGPGGLWAEVFDSSGVAVFVATQNGTISGAQTFTASIGASNTKTCQMFAFAGASATLADVQISHLPGASSSPQCPAGTAASSGSMSLQCVRQHSSTGGTYTPPASTTKTGETNGVASKLVAGWAFAAGGVNGPYTWSSTSSQNYISVTAVVSPSSPPIGGTTAQTFEFADTDQTFTMPFEVDIRTLVEPTGIATNRQTNHPNAAGTTDITLLPGANSATQTDTTGVNGWTINRALMASITGNRRVVRSGTWTISIGATVPAAGLLGSHTASFLLVLFRVLASGGRQFLWVSPRSSTVTTPAGLGTSGTCTATGNPGQIVLEHDETLMVGVLARNVQVAGTLGATTAGNVTWDTNAGSVAVASPGIRTFFTRAATPDSAPASDNSVIREFHGFRQVVDAAAAIDSVTREFHGSRQLADLAAATDVAARRGEFYRTVETQLAPADDATTRIARFRRNPVDLGPAADTPTREFHGARQLADLAAATDIVARKITYGRSITEGPADIITFPGFKELTGLAYDPDGTPYEGAEIWLIRLADDRHIRTTTSDADGVWQFDRDLFDAQSYMVYGFTTIGGVQHADVSDRGLTVVDVGSVTPGDPLNGADANVYLVPQGVGSGGGGEGGAPTTLLVDGELALRLAGRLYRTP